MTGSKEPVTRIYPHNKGEIRMSDKNKEIKMNLVELGLGGGKLLQVANRSHIQSMLYLIETPNGKTILIDSGNYKKDEDGKHLYELIKQRGGKVDAWIITHAHDDHFGGLLWILENVENPQLEIGSLYFNFPPIDWVGTIDPRMRKYVEKFYANIEQYGIIPKTIKKGDVISVDGIFIEVLNDLEGYEDYTNINDTTIALLVHFPKRKVLFLGDLDVDGGKNLLSVCPHEKLRQDIVQMAHHGQNGADKEFYTHVMPKICLYCAPDWLWENDNGGGGDSGPWKTLETRAWMEELGALVSCPHAYGDYLFW